MVSANGGMLGPESLVAEQIVLVLRVHFDLLHVEIRTLGVLGALYVAAMQEVNQQCSAIQTGRKPLEIGGRHVQRSSSK